MPNRDEQPTTSASVGDLHDIFRVKLKEPVKPDSEQLQRQLQRIEDKIDALDRKINLIFGDMVLLNGRWIPLTTPTEGQ